MKQSARLWHRGLTNDCPARIGSWQSRISGVESCVEEGGARVGRGGDVSSALGRGFSLVVSTVGSIGAVHYSFAGSTSVTATDGVTIILRL